MRRIKYFHKLYKFNEENKKYLIEVSLDDYNDVYNDWDPSPFKKRDIEQEFNDFIVDSSEDIPLKYEISIALYLPLSKKNLKKEASLISAYSNYYNYSMERMNKAKSNLNKRTISYFFLSVLLLSIGYFFFEVKKSLLIKVLHEGIFIGGWVFLWEFFTNIFIIRRKLQNEYNIYKRLFGANIQFIYIQ